MATANAVTGLDIRLKSSGFIRILIEKGANKTDKDWSSIAKEVVDVMSQLFERLGEVVKNIIFSPLDFRCLKSE